MRPLHPCMVQETANGVVVITTKRGKERIPVVHLSSSIGVTPGWATDNYESAGIQEQINMLYRVLYDNSTSGGQTAAQANAPSRTLGGSIRGSINMDI